MRTGSWNAAVLGLALVITNCGDGDDDGASDGEAHEGDASEQQHPPNVARGDLMITFSPMYSAYIDDDHPCTVPAIVLGVPAGLRWTASDDSMVDLDQNADGSVLITTKKAGTVEIIVRIDDEAGHSTLTISPFSLAEWQAGERRYNSDVAYQPPTKEELSAAIREAEKEADGGVPDFDPVYRRLKPPAGTGCVACHDNDSSTLAPEYTPQQAGGLSDTDMVKAITTGELPPSPSAEPTPPLVLDLFHSDAANLNAAQARNIVAYMRSLPPKAIGPIDFGGLGTAN